MAGSNPNTPIVKSIIQGEFGISDNPDEAISTILGSCVAAFLRDPISGIGGMNHFLLPGTDQSERNALKYGINAMELLINALIQAGARRRQLEGKLFGGAKMVAGLSDIGAANAEFAEEFLRKEGIRYLGGSLGGDYGRKIRAWPATGQIQQMRLPRNQVIEAPETSKKNNQVLLF